jgi:hypothetical protein
MEARRNRSEKLNAGAKQDGSNKMSPVSKFTAGNSRKMFISLNTKQQGSSRKLALLVLVKPGL